MGTAREIYLWSGLVVALPAIVLGLAQTAAFPTFRAAWTEASLWMIVLIVFPFWSVLTSYAGVRERFAVKRGRAILWFLVLPWLLFAVSFTGLAASLLHMELKSSPAKTVRPAGSSV